LTINSENINNNENEQKLFALNQQHIESIRHILNLESTGHNLRLVLRGEKRPESEGTRVYITSAIIFKTAPKKIDTFKFSFER
jgi:hypothetical protein